MKVERLKVYTNTGNRQTPCKMESNGCTAKDEVGNRVPNTPVNFQLITDRIGLAEHFSCDRAASDCPVHSYNK